MYLQSGSETTEHLLYLPATANLSAGANFSQLAPVVDEQQFIVRDWPTAGEERGASGDAGDVDGNGEDSGSGSGSGRYIYAVVYSAERRNGELVVASLGPNALAGAAGGAQGSAPAAEGAGGNATAAPAPTPAPVRAPAPAAAPAAAPGSSIATGGAATNATGGSGAAAGGGNATSAGSGSDSGSGADTPGGGGGSGGYFALLQAHSRDIELVDISLSSGHLAVLERRNGSLVATAYALPKDGGWRGVVGGGRRVPHAACTGGAGWVTARPAVQALRAPTECVIFSRWCKLAMPWRPPTPLCRCGAPCRRRPAGGAAHRPAV